MSTDLSNYDENTVNIERIKFTIFSNDEIKRYSAVSSDPYGINSYESYNNYTPIQGGLVDPRLGTCDMFIPCTTCGLDNNDCPGHFGHTELAEPVFHLGFLTHTKDILTCVCYNCSKLLVDDKEKYKKDLEHKSNRARFSEIKTIAKKATYCFNCGAPVPKIKKDIKESSGSIKMSYETTVQTTLKDEKSGLQEDIKKTIKDYWSPRNVYDILAVIDDVDSWLLGFNVENNKPKDLIIKNFPIPPVVIRPTAKIDFLASSTSEDSLTLKIADIIKASIRRRKQIQRETLSGEESKFNTDTLNLLQYHVATYFDNENISLPKSEYKTGGKPTKSISQRIKGKTGRIRSNLMGKRVDFSARSVITSDPNIDIDEVGIPLKVAKDLTIPEEVTPYNVKYLSQLVKNGQDVYPGANFVYQKKKINGKEINHMINLRFCKRTINLNIGDVVARHIKDGDYVLFNRQPTLHKPSMMGHKIKVLNKPNVDTFRINVSVTEPYNADFDGDEMNLHVPQSIVARNELERIANVKYQIISAKDSKPIIGCKQDAIAGAYVMTFDSTRITGHEAMNMLATTSFDNYGAIDKNKSYTGQEIFSHIIPKGINSEKYNDEGKVVFLIKDGELIKGKLNKPSLADQKNSIIHYIYDKLGPDYSRKFIDDTQRIILSYLLNYGLTVGYGDTIIDTDLLEKMRNIIDTKELQNKYQLTEAENDTNDIDPNIIEDSLAAELQAVAPDIGKMVSDSLDPAINSFSTMEKSGAKGSLTNIVQITTILGQQMVDSKRIPRKVNNRSLPHYHQFDDTPVARGFVKPSFLDGLGPADFFFHSMGGREGLIDTAIKTATTGYIQRKLVKGLEDIHVAYDGTVRNANGLLMQPCFGDNGINQSFQTEIKLSILNMNNDKIKSIFVFDKKDMDKISSKHKMSASDITKYNKTMYDTMIDYRDQIRTIQRYAFNNYRVLEEMFMLPINLVRIIQDYKSDKECAIHPDIIIEKLEKFLSHESTELFAINNKMNKFRLNDEKESKFLLRVAVYEYLSPKRCLFEYKIDEDRLDELIANMILSFNRAVVEPGEMVGVVAAQSIGEGTTQMTLNTKHSAGLSKGSAMGVPRIKELLNNAKSIKSPNMYIYIKDEFVDHKPSVSRIVSHLKTLYINNLYDRAEILYNPGDNNKLAQKIKDDKVSAPFFIPNLKGDLDSMQWLFRIELSREKMMDKDTTLMDVKTKFVTYWLNNFLDNKTMKKDEKELFAKITKCAILSNFDTSPVPTIHIKFSLSSYDYVTLEKFWNVVKSQIILKGIPNIKGTEISHENIIIFNKDTGDVEKKKQYVAVSDGINLINLRFIKGIDHNKTMCNDIETIHKLYGIEAARSFLLNELRATYGGSLNYHHFSVLVDVMTHTGSITSIDRHGMNKLDTDPLAKASFEKQMEHLLLAAIYNESDYMRSISSRIMVGRCIKGGTGMFDLMLDTEMLENSEITDNETGGYTHVEKLDEDVFMKDINNKDNINDDFFIPV
jgi:DNA-directed RNA polymerase II subunit RPB1